MQRFAQIKTNNPTDTGSIFWTLREYTVRYSNFCAYSLVSRSVLLTRYYSSRKIKNEMGVACSTYRVDER